MFSFTEWGMQGAVYQMLNHGVSTGALFLLVGFIYERRHTRAITRFRRPGERDADLRDDLRHHDDVVDRPAVPERFRRRISDHDRDVQIARTRRITGSGANWNYVATMFAGTGVIFAAVYLLWMVQRVFFGKVTNAKNRVLADLSWREIGMMVPLLFADGLHGRLSEAVP